MKTKGTTLHIRQFFGVLFNDAVSRYDYTALDVDEEVWSTGGIIPTGREWGTKTLAEKPVPVPLCPSQVPQGLACIETQASAMTAENFQLNHCTGQLAIITNPQVGGVKAPGSGAV
jgi:hypothetical protein